MQPRNDSNETAQAETDSVPPRRALIERVVADQLAVKTASFDGDVRRVFVGDIVEVKPPVPTATLANARGWKWPVGSPDDSTPIDIHDATETVDTEPVEMTVRPHDGTLVLVADLDQHRPPHDRRYGNVWFGQVIDVWAGDQIDDPRCRP